MYEHARIANENARLAILKQGEMVHCLAQLASVLRHGLTMSSAQALPHVAKAFNFPKSTENTNLYASGSNISTTLPCAASPTQLPPTHSAVLEHSAGLEQTAGPKHGGLFTHTTELTAHATSPNGLEHHNKEV